MGVCSSERGRARLLWSGMAVLAKYADQLCSLSHEAPLYVILQKLLQCVALKQPQMLFFTGIIDVILNVNTFQFHCTHEGSIRLASLCKFYQRCVKAYIQYHQHTLLM